MGDEKRAWTYYRVANGDPELMEAQRNELLRHAKSLGYKVVGESYDTGSGRCMDREGIKEVSAAAASGQQMDAVLIKKVSCLGRDILPTLAYIAQLNRWGVEAVSIAEGTIRITAPNEAIDNIIDTIQM
ncbi:recombinase family protein [Desulfosporosinus metallidurans]|uniref:Resolvase/invertase-type recombinase catalytic domain-containing protein n=1 Tax=Desulfosporosinus metallidurans TaxID=1888891 RepID=A0A1Q8R018_9FIRM|nr:recombinase family protein [Desulfosporosinus metallidurans]OLN32906.1 hypothetical protein DSOL_1017 [Desulfosporosinus metallidurans]